MSTYFAILTAVGEAQLSNAIAQDKQVSLTQMAVGDGGGELPTPERSQTELTSEQYRAALNSLTVDELNASQIVAEMVIPETEGGWWVREIGVFDKDGNLFAVANCPPSYKPVMAEGSGRTQVIRVVLLVSSASAVQLKVDPSVVLATKAEVQRTMNEHIESENPHAQYAKTEDVGLDDGDADYRLRVINGCLALEEK